MRNTILAGAIASFFVAGAAFGGCGGSTSGGGTDGGGGGGPDTGAPSDATSDGIVCVTLEPLSYNRTCTQDSECTVIATGQLCTGGCGCGDTPINSSEMPKYQAQLAGVSLLACPCASPGRPRCVQKACTLCTFGPTNPPGCPDAG